MSLILLLLGAALASAGGALIGFGIPINELVLGTTLILAGSIAVVGGLVLVGLAAVVRELARVSSALKEAQAPHAADVGAHDAPALQLPVPPTEVIAREPVKESAEEPAKDVQEPATESSKAIEIPSVAASPTVEVSASAIERLRSSIPRADKAIPEPADVVPLSPNGQQAGHRLEVAPKVELLPRSAGAAAVETREPRLDFLFRPRQPQQPRRDGQPVVPRLEALHSPAAAAAGQLAPEAESATKPSPVPQERPLAILKSGVVDGMAYTLFANGSIEAQLPQGMVHFGSIAELRAHIENNA